ncbi:MAG: ABC transporter substrate-binding protein [Dehalococcoidia bacterium]|nr:ABC transporter substrate-binding protein [Dehalococcoidia bacterium]
MNHKFWLPGILVLFGMVALAMSACAPAAPPATPTPTKSAAATPTQAAPKPSPAVQATPLQPTAPAKPTTVRFGSPGLLTDAGVFIAMDKGYFKEQGINMELVPFKTAPDAIPPLATGDLEVTGGSLGAAIFNAYLRGIKLKIVADKSSHPTYQSSAAAVLIRQDLWDAGQIKTPADLKGKKLGSPCTQCVIDYFYRDLLKQGNLTLKDVELVTLGQPDIVIGLTNKALDLGYLVEPFVTTTQDKGIAREWKRHFDVVPGSAGAALVFSESFAKNQDAARRFMVAYLKAVRDYNDAFLKNKGKEEVISILIKNTTTKDRPLYDKMIMGGLDPNGALNVQDIARQLDFYMEVGGVKEKVDLKEIIDTQFVDYAVQKLGKY